MTRLPHRLGRDQPVPSLRAGRSLAGCAATTSAARASRASCRGDGTITVARPGRPRGARRGGRARPSTASRCRSPTTRPGRRGQRLGLVVRAVPGRGADARRRRARPRRRTDVAFLGIDSRDPSEPAAQAFVRRFDIPYPSIYDPQGSTLLAFRGTLPPNAIPSTVVIDARAGSPRACSARSPARRCTTSSRRLGGRRWLDWFREHRALRVAAAGAPGRGGRRPGVVLLALRRAAAAGLPLLRHRAVRGRPRPPPGAGRMLLGTALFVLGFSFVFVVARHALRGARRVAVGVHARRSASCSAW